MYPKCESCDEELFKNSLYRFCAPCQEGADLLNQNALRFKDERIAELEVEVRYLNNRLEDLLEME